MASETEQVKEGKTVVVDGKKLHDYELVVIANPEATDEKLETRLNSISQFITTRGGTVDNLDRWGKRKLTFPIKKSLEGNYIIFHMKLPPEVSRELEANLRISEDILRHMLVRVDSK